jgi:hypothetical protein
MKGRYDKKSGRLKRYRDIRPPMPLLNAEQAGWLRRLIEGPMRRDGNSDPLPYGMATIFLDYQLIEPFTEFSHGAGIVRQSWRCWRITQSGEQALRTARKEAN